MKKNLTLTIDEDVLERARLEAVRSRRSLTSLVREFLERLGTDERIRLAASRRLGRLMSRRPLVVGRREWTRDELHER